jgi:hypothetical protein
MKFLNKTEARKFLEEKHMQNNALTQEELLAVKEHFTEEELSDMSYVKYNIEDCFNFDPCDI